MIVTEYDDCISLKYYDSPEVKIDRKTHEATVELNLLNGRKTEIDLAIKRKKDGTQKIVELLLPKGLSKEDVDDIAGLHWRIFPAKERGRKLLPVVDCWEKGGEVLVACLSQKYGIEKKSFAAQWRFAEDPEVPPDPERLLCWWPDPHAWEIMKETKTYSKYFPLQGYALPFYTFSEWFKRPDTKDVVYAERALEYARYIRRLRTMLLFCRQKNIPVNLTVGKVEKAFDVFEKKSLDPTEQTSWAYAASLFEEMPDVLVEKILPCGPAGIVSSRRQAEATLTYFSHMPESPMLDCVGASIHSGKTRLCGLIAWLNPLAGEAVYEEAADALFDTFKEYDVTKVCTVNGVLPFESCPECGGLSLRVADSNEPVRVGPKVGRNDPCPCGSGKKYKKCCGKDV